MGIDSKINSSTTIGEIIRLKGTAAAELIDAALCDNQEKACCPSTTLQLGFAASLKGKKNQLQELIENLNRL